MPGEARIRTVHADDAEDVVAVTGAIEQMSFSTAQTFRALVERGAPATTERLVAEIDDALVAWAPSGLHGDGSGWFWIGVATSARHRGVGGALYERIEQRLRALGVETLRTQINDEDGRSFLEHRGFARTNVMRVHAIDLESAKLPAPPTETDPLSSIDVDAIRRLFLEGRSDVVSRAPRAVFDDEDFRREVADSELVDRDVSSVLLEAGSPVALALVIANRPERRAGARFTTVRRDRRGRGLAFAVKVASLHRAREAGYRTMVTWNDVENERILAINRRLGFQPSILVDQYAKTL